MVKVETLLILRENLFELLLEMGVPVSKWVFSVPDRLIRPSAAGKMNFPFSL